MKCTFESRLWQLLVIMMLLTGSLFAESSATILYPGQGTTLNGKAVYLSAVLVAGDQVQTATATGKIAAAGMELDMAPDTTVVIGEPLVLNCGEVVVRSGTAEISDGKSTASLAAGESAHAASPYCRATLPDAPSAVRSEQNPPSPPASRRLSRSTGAAPAATGSILYVDSKVADWSYWTVNGAMLSSSLISVHLTQECLHSGACSFVPNAFHSRAAMYGAGLPAAAGVSYFSYYLKRKGYRWWFVPAAVVTAGNIAVSTHAAHYSH